MDRPLRLSSVMGVARALLATVSVHDAVTILVDEFGWDAALQATALLTGPEAELAFGEVWTRLLVDPIALELREALQMRAEG